MRRSRRSGAPEEADGVGSDAGSLRFVEVIGSHAESASGSVTLEFCDGLTLRFEALPSPWYLAEVVAALAGE